MNPILLLHGALGSKTQLEHLREKLQRQGREVYSMNFSGHSGEPFRSSFGIEIFAEDVIRFLDHEKLSKVDVFGYSMGGYVAVWLAHLFPHCIGGIITLGTKFDWSPESAEKEVKKLNADKILEKLPAFARILEHRHAPNDWKELLRKTSAMMLSLGSHPLLTEEIIRTIQHPVYICLGDQDDMADRNFSRQVADWLPGGSFHLFESTPHPIEKVEIDHLVKMF